MRFKIDENLPEDVAEKLREAGWDAVSVVQQRLAGADDGRVSEACDAENRILVTLDQGFSNIRAYMPRAHPGFIVYRLRSQDKRHVNTCASRAAVRVRWQASETPHPPSAPSPRCGGEKGLVFWSCARGRIHSFPFPQLSQPTAPVSIHSFFSIPGFLNPEQSSV
jgi:predicted nuclease of predicted toxin-antitoxin system